MTTEALPVPEPNQAPPPRIPDDQKTWFARYWRQIRTVLTWTGFAAIIYYLSNFLSLIFLTFILAYTLNSLVNYLHARIQWPRWAVVLEVYLILAIIMTTMGMIVIPKVYQEGKIMYKEIPETKDKVIQQIKGLMQDEDLAGFIQGAGVEEGFKEWFGKMLQRFTLFIQDIFRISFHFILAVIFSFLILWDFERFSREVRGLESTRLRTVYRILAPRLQEFGDIVGRAFEAQIIIAWVNTFLTLIGLTFLGIPSKLFLSVFVFVCSFIPVLGVFISSAPICLLAYKADGFILVFYSAILITIIHFIEAYILNPRIVGGHLSLHPFVAVSILVFSEYFFGIWGLLLGVPCAVFLYHALLTRPTQKRPAQNGSVATPKNPLSPETAAT
ncbi:MAG TPA: AI-2E family transporter [Candidatus Ozemobacteraceae bacterium]|nr:AI-2E family transporter [Candidatus Ozemobacteraceae bacterium]HQG28643.1 AI-2E family transporter [Candidatus Ozemobacteraceae bacterium]